MNIKKMFTKFSGPDYYITFELSIIQNIDNEVNIFYDDILDSKHVLQYISGGIEFFYPFLRLSD